MNKWILLRGLARGNGHWGEFPKLLQALAPEIDFELLEIPGNGTRNNETSPLTADAVINKLRKCSRIAKENKTFNLLGISLGGMIGLKWAELFPEEITKLVVINSSLAQYSNFTSRLMPHQYQHLLRALLSTNIANQQALVLKIVSNDPKMRKKYLSSMVEFSKQYPTTLNNFLRQLILAKFIKIKPDKVKSQLVFLCSRKDKLVSYTCSQLMAEKFQAKLVMHPKAGHDLPLDAPQWLVQQILKLS